MKTEFEKMRSQELYDFSDSEVLASVERANKLCARLSLLTTTDGDYRDTIERLIPGIPKSSTVVPPFRCDHGHGIVIGENTFINYGGIFLDGGMIRIGRNVKIGPSCRIYTPQHPVDYMGRREPKETAYPVTIGDDTWIGGSVTICPGVTIGSRCVVAAGSVVIRDIPDDSLAAGNPAVIKRRLGQ